eukprot:TRINITY_DN90606_c0_g1_i1.p1 TRINITY_DN90606_c0_g1~~TRINITY_DN90606_c0_g1_i1.p1  ORF type:complete len:316 (-),score=47.05 TRINITY_DN90606_c0_g1_i1:33-839(-)
MSGQMQYMREAIPELERDPQVFRYAWFSYSFQGAKAELISNGKLTELGLLYSSFGGHPTPTTITTTTTTATPVPETIFLKQVVASGNMTLSVQNPAVFVKDPIAKAGLRKAQAKLAKVDESQVQVSLSLSSERSSGTGRRRLQTQSRGQVLVQFTVTSNISANETEAQLGQRMLTNLQGISREEVINEIAASIKQLAAETGGSKNYSVDVLEMSMPTHVSVQKLLSSITSTTTAAPPAELQGVAANSVKVKASMFVFSLLSLIVLGLS